MHSPNSAARAAPDRLTPRPTHRESRSQRECTDEGADGRSFLQRHQGTFRVSAAEARAKTAAFLPNRRACRVGVSQTKRSFGPPQSQPLETKLFSRHANLARHSPAIREISATDSSAVRLYDKARSRGPANEEVTQQPQASRIRLQRRSLWGRPGVPAPPTAASWMPCISLPRLPAIAPR